MYFILITRENHSVYIHNIEHGYDLKGPSSLQTVKTETETISTNHGLLILARIQFIALNRIKAKEIKTRDSAEFEKKEKNKPKQK